MRTLHISTASSRFSKAWSVEDITWDELASRCANCRRTPETARQYAELPQPRQADIKDVGGFVGGVIVGGRRTKGSVQERDILTLDLDYATPSTWEDFTYAFPSTTALMYSTHKHTPEKPRLRLVLPLSRTVTPDEYEAIARAVAAKFDIEQFDDTTYAPERLMYWPSASADADFFFDRQDINPLDADAILATYADWHDVTLWPVSSRTPALREREKRRAGDPTAKRGVVGDFCRTYDIPAAIEHFLPDIYTPAGKNRYTYVPGTAAAGLVVYDDGKFAYANNATDPCSGHLVNAFDLVRLHLYADDDKDADPRTLPQNRPSYTRMVELSRTDDNVQRQRFAERQEEARRYFADVTRTDTTEEPETDNAAEVKQSLKPNAKGDAPVVDVNNFIIILTTDNKFRGRLWYDEFQHRRYARGLYWLGREREKGTCWTDTDEANLRHYIENTYQMYNRPKLQDALDKVFGDNRRNPLADYLSSLEWDTTPRLDTLLIDFLGAPDTPIVRLMTRRHLVGGVARVLDPGCQHDYCIVLAGEQGIGKSSLLKRLGGDYFCDSLQSMDNKDALELVNTAWIIELPELAATRKSEVEQVKSFLTTRKDEYRPPYARNKETRYRQCIFFGTTNADDFLRDTTGNRRFWVIPVDATRRKLPIAELTDEYRDQVWAEALQYYLNHEPQYLDPEQEREVERVRRGYVDIAQDGRLGIIENYLNTLLPADWKSRNIELRRAFFTNLDPIQPEGITPRDEVSVAEILSECFKKDPDERYRTQRKDIKFLMAQLPDWKYTGEIQRCGPYGTQRVYRRTRPLIPTNTDGDI